MRRPPDRTTAGFTLIAAMVLAGVVAVLVATYSRHVIAESWSSMATGASIGAREECYSNLQYARYALLSGEGSRLNVQGALAKLQEIELGELIRIDDGKQTVRVWVE